MFQLLISLIGAIVPICVVHRPINATTAPAREETRCASAWRRKGVSNVHCGAIPSQSGRIQGVAHQHSAFAERNEGIPRSRDDIHDACRKRRMDGGSSTALVEEEEQILKCLGAAVLMRWNTVPTKLQRDWQFWGFPAGRPESVKIDHFKDTTVLCTVGGGASRGASSSGHSRS